MLIEYIVQVIIAQMMGLLMALINFLKLQHNHIQHVKFGLNFQTQKLDNTQE
jgi:hypothetical protein